MSWDEFFLGLAKTYAQKSKDPSTRVGAVIVDQQHRFVSAGYNGFPSKIKDGYERLHDRAVKMTLTLHAENNAIGFAKRDVTGCTIYTWPFQPCAACSLMIIRDGITRVVAPPLPPELKERWQSNCLLALSLFEEAGIKVDFLELKDDQN